MTAASTQHATAAKVIRLLVRALIGLGIAILAAYPADWAIWRIRSAMGNGMDQIEIHHYTTASLKGNKQDYYVEGADVEPCSKSLFPEAGAGPCWWLRRHTEEIVSY